MPRHRSHSIAFKRQVAQEYIGGETLHGLAKRHDLSRNLIRIWVGKYEAGAFDDDAMAADLVQEQEARIAALERLVGRQALEHASGAQTFKSKCRSCHCYLPARQPFHSWQKKLDASEVQVANQALGVRICEFNVPLKSRRSVF